MSTGKEKVQKILEWLSIILIILGFAQAIIEFIIANMPPQLVNEAWIAGVSLKALVKCVVQR